MLFATAGVVLAAGGLGVAALGSGAQEPGPRPSTATDETPDGGAAELPPSATTESAPAPGTSPASPSAEPSTSSSPSASASQSEEAEPEEAAETAGQSGPPAQQTSAPRPTREPTRTPPAGPGTPDAPKPTTGKPDPEPEPEPEPSKTCDRFLWWCT
ncbi:hypothetical protein [Streptomyces sp. NPDC029526]|uniref:hypothetical protein n=1 Tax=Streptomyces sp. NPDC029526 TaxID=3155728 RepID=UPI0033F98325